MTTAELRRYRFESVDQWRSAGIAGATTVDGVKIALPLRWTAIGGTDAGNTTSAIAHDACDRLTWCQPDRSLIRLYEFGVERRGSLLGGTFPGALIVDSDRVWFLSDERLYRYREPDLLFLGEVTAERSIRAIAGDRHNGVWFLQGGDAQPATLIHLDSIARRLQTPIALPAPLSTAAIAVSHCGRCVVVLDPAARTIACPDACCRKASWAVLVIDTCTDAVQSIPGIGVNDPSFHPNLVAVDATDLVYLVDATSGASLTIDLTGQVRAETDLSLPDNALPLRGLSAGRSLAVAGANGILLAEPTSGESVGTFGLSATVITPTLISPEGDNRGWQRADIDALLPDGTTLTITPAAGDRALARTIDQVFADPTLSPAAKVAQLTTRLPWQTDRSAVFSSVSTQQRVRLHYALHEIDTEYLWLRFDLHAPPGRRPPSLRRLDVLYFNLSYIEHLPPVYQRDPPSAAQLRRFLALFEGLFGDFDVLIDRLPQSIDPATAPDKWLPLLLAWLGFPPMAGLSPARARELLARAGDLLTRRGTVGALHDLLGIITGRSVEIDDAADGPSPWVLPTDTGASEPPRLGRDTLVLDHKTPSPFALGWSAGLGKVPLGQDCAPGMSAFARQSGSLTIRIATPPSERETLGPLLAAILPHFVPAHCHYRILYVPTLSSPLAGRLNQDLRLAGGRSPDLGPDFILGCQRLPRQSADGAIIGRTAELDCRLYLS